MNEHRPYDPYRKAVPSSDLSARDEFRFWVPIDLICLLALVAVTAAFPANNDDVPGLPQLFAPVLGWLIGSGVAPLLQPRKIKTPSWLIAVVALVIVAICAVAFPGNWTAFGRGFGGFIIGLAGGILILRSWLANREG